MTEPPRREDPSTPETVRIRHGESVLLVRTRGPELRPRVAQPVQSVVAPPVPVPVPENRRPASEPRQGLSLGLGYKPVVALVEAAPSGADELMLNLISLVEEERGTCGVISLDRQNRMAGRLGCVAPSPQWCWNSAAPELFIPQGARVVVPAPDPEAGLAPEAVQQVVRKVTELADVVVVDLGCRWEPRLFRPVLMLASHVWFVTRAGQWTAMEMRLEQAEFSGWTDMSRVRSVALGDTQSVPIGAHSIVTLPAAGGWITREFLLRELRGARR